jgi:hypothetical protein
VGIKAVALAPLGSNDVLVAGDLGSQSTNVNIDGSEVRCGFPTPLRYRRDLRSGYGAAGILYQVGKQLEFFAGQLSVPAINKQALSV